MRVGSGPELPLAVRARCSRKPSWRRCLCEEYVGTLRCPGIGGDARDFVLRKGLPHLQHRLVDPGTSTAVDDEPAGLHATDCAHPFA